MVKIITPDTPCVFLFEGKWYRGLWSEFQTDSTHPLLSRPQIHVSVKYPKEQWGLFFQYYRISEDELFWFDLPDWKQEMARTIANALINGL